MDFLDRIIDYIEDNVVIEKNIRIGKLEQNSSAISIRPTPGSVPNRYVDDDKIREYNFQILIKDTNQLKVIQKTEEITSLLDGLKSNGIVSSNNSFRLVSCKVYVPPNYVEETDREEYIYTAMFTAELQGGI